MTKKKLQFTKISTKYNYMVSVSSHHYFCKNLAEVKMLREALKKRGFKKVYTRKL